LIIEVQLVGWMRNRFDMTDELIKKYEEISRNYRINLRYYLAENIK
jgi:hypothetical protein